VAAPTEVVVSLAEADVTPLCLELGLLLLGETTALQLNAGEDRLDLEIAKKAQHPQASFARGKARGLRCTLDRDGVEYLQATLLRAWRDGAAEVDHIHIEGALAGSDHDLTVRFAKAQAPMSAAQARRKLTK
jgi:hypothetical protein